MDTYEKFLSAVAEKRAPTTLIPLYVEWAIEEQERLSKSSVRRKALIRAIFYVTLLLWFIGAVILISTSHDQKDKSLLGVVLGFAPLVFIIILGIMYICSDETPQKQKEKRLDGLGCSLAEFAERFMTLMTIFGQAGERMAGWDIDKIEEFARSVLRTHAQTIKTIQKDNPGNAIADVPAKQEFRRIYEILGAWKLVSGPWDPYFA